MAKKQKASKAAPKAKEMALTPSEAAPQGDSEDLDFKPGLPANTTLSDWLSIHSDDEVTRIENRGTYWRTFLA